MSLKVCTSHVFDVKIYHRWYQKLPVNCWRKQKKIVVCAHVCVALKGGFILPTGRGSQNNRPKWGLRSGGKSLGHFRSGSWPSAPYSPPGSLKHSPDLCQDIFPKHDSSRSPMLLMAPSTQAPRVYREWEEEDQWNLWLFRVQSLYHCPGLQPRLWPFNLLLWCRQVRWPMGPAQNNLRKN